MGILDLFSPDNYLMINKDAIKILGLNTAVYCSILSSICSKVINKNKYVNEYKYFEVDRKYIEKQTQLNTEEQLKCDLNLAKVNIIKINEENPNIIYFDTEVYASLLSSENIKLLDKVSEKVKIENPKGLKGATKKASIQAIKNSIECRTPEVITRLYTWIDSIFEAGKGISKAQVKLFKDQLDDYCNGDLYKAIKLLDIAIATNYTNFEWVKNNYEKATKPTNIITTPQVRVSTQRRTTEISEVTF